MHRLAKVTAPLLLVLTIAVIAPRSAAASSILFDQTTGLTGNGVISQTFSDFPTFTTHSFDDFSTTQAFDITTFTVLGIEQGNPALNTAVVGEIWSGLPGSGSLVLSSISGMEAGGNLSIDFGGQLLAAGNYWITAYVARDFTGGGQWFAGERLPVTGSQAFLYNPGGGLGFGTAPFPISFLPPFTPMDLAYKLEGDPAAVVPEPASLLLLGTGLAATVARRIGKRK